MDPVDIELFKPAGRRYRCVLHRRDGLLIELDGGGYVGADLALAAGLWG